MLFAFSHGAVPAAKVWSKLSAKRVPVAGVILVAVFSLVITAPTLIPVDIGGVPSPIAFDAVVSIGVIALYWCFAIPIWHRWRMGAKFKQGHWNPRHEVQVDRHHRADRHRPGLVDGLHAHLEPGRAVDHRVLHEVRELHDPGFPGVPHLLVDRLVHASVKELVHRPQAAIEQEIIEELPGASTTPPCCCPEPGAWLASLR